MGIFNKKSCDCICAIELLNNKLNRLATRLDILELEMLKKETGRRKVSRPKGSKKQNHEGE